MLSLFHQITTFIFDVDGVLTDGSLLLLPDGEMARTMNVKDGYALQLAVKQGYTIAIISGGISSLVQERFEKLGIRHIFMGVHNKPETLNSFLATQGIAHEHTLFMGDDIPDLAAMESCALPCCPTDAVAEIQAISKYISPLKGGAGCARDVIEKVMKLQGKWHAVAGVASR